MFNFILTHQVEVLEKSFEHISLSLTAVLLACLVGIPIGFLIVYRPKLSNIVLNCANIIQTIPSLAMFALFLYALLPILKNTLLGIKNVDPAIIKAATGMGMSKRQILFMVEVPLSISIIMGGIRIATVTSIGLATIATLIAAGGLGDFIYQGLSNFNQAMILSGAFLSALFALIADFCLGLVENRLTSNGLKSDNKQKKRKRFKRKKSLNIVLTTVIIVIVFFALIFNAKQEQEDPIIIVHKNYTEQRLLGEAIGQFLEYEGYNTEVKELGGTMLCFNALDSGEADMYPEFNKKIVMMY